MSNTDLGSGYQMQISNFNKNLIRGRRYGIHGKYASSNKRRRTYGYGL